MANWASGASEGLTQGINNAINIMAAKRAQEDQAYQDKVRQQTAAEYEFNHTPVASIDDIVNTFNVSTPEAKAKIKSHVQALSPGQSMFNRKQLIDMINTYKGDPMFHKSIAAEEYNGLNKILGSAKPDEKVGITSMMEASPWYQGHAAEVAAKKELEAKRAREAAEEKRKNEEHPLKLEGMKTDIEYTKAKAREAGKPSGVGGGGLTAKQLYDIEDKRRKEATGRVEKRLKWYDDYIQEYEGMNNKPKNYNQVIEYRNKTQKVLDRIHSGELDPTKLIWGGQSSQWQQVAPGSNVTAFDINTGKTSATLTPQEQNLLAQNGASGKYAGIDDRNNVGVPGQLTTQVFYDQSSGKYFTPRKKKTTQPKKAYGEIEWRAMGDAARKEASKNGTPIVKKRPENIPGNLSEMLDYIKR